MNLSKGPGVGSPGCDLGGFLEEDMGLCPLPLWGLGRGKELVEKGFQSQCSPCLQ